MSKEQEKELLKILEGVGFEYDSYNQLTESEEFPLNITLSDEGVSIKNGTIPSQPADQLLQNVTYDLLNDDDRFSFVVAIIVDLNRDSRYNNSKNNNLIQCELYHQAKINNFGFAFEQNTKGIMINGRLIIYYPIIEEGLGEFDKFRVIVYKTNTVRKKDIVFKDESTDIYYLSTEVMKLCAV